MTPNFSSLPQPKRHVAPIILGTIISTVIFLGIPAGFIHLPTLPYQKYEATTLVSPVMNIPNALPTPQKTVHNAVQSVAVATGVVQTKAELQSKQLPTLDNPRIFIPRGDTTAQIPAPVTLLALNTGAVGLPLPKGGTKVTLAPQPKQAIAQPVLVAKLPQTAEAAITPASTTKVVLISKPTPIYTTLATAKKIQGQVVLHVTFTADGKVKVINVEKSLGYGLDEAAIKAVQTYKFTAATRNGKPIDFTTSITVDFQIA